MARVPRSRERREGWKSKVAALGLLKRLGDVCARRVWHVFLAPRERRKAARWWKSKVAALRLLKRLGEVLSARGAVWPRVLRSSRAARWWKSKVTALWLLSARTEQRVRETMHEWAPLFAGLPFESRSFADVLPTPCGYFLFSGTISSRMRSLDACSDTASATGQASFRRSICGTIPEVDTVTRRRLKP